MIPSPQLAEEIIRATVQARAQGKTHEMTTLTVLAILEQAGIRALALKGSVLARELYDDVAARSSGDIDVLVAAEDLTPAIKVVEKMGWCFENPVSRLSRLPVLHETLTHPTLPRVELHWRVHWYETRFSTDALERAERPAAHQPLVMLPADGLAALTLFYQRDGFSGLRMAADVAAWWDAKCAGPSADQLIGSVANTYPELSAPLWVGTQLLGSLVGLPTRFHGGSFRWRVASELAAPFFAGAPAQLGANASLVDLLLAPHGSRAHALRRETQKIPEQLERPLTRHDGLADHLARWEHLLRVSRRWLLSLPRAVERAYRRGPVPVSLPSEWSER